MERRDIIFKGTRDGLTVILPEGPEPERLAILLDEKLASSNGFFRGAEAVLDFGMRPLNESVIGILEGVARRHEIRITKAMGTATVTRVLTLGLESREVEKSQDKIEDRRPLVSNQETLLLKRHFRSGQRLSYPGNVVVVGDINPGAEIIAGGDIIVIGALRGVAHAGAPENRDAVVLALKLCPTQLRIADLIARAPDGSARSAARPEVAHIQGKDIVVEELL